MGFYLVAKTVAALLIHEIVIPSNHLAKNDSVVFRESWTANDENVFTSNWRILRQFLPMPGDAMSRRCGGRLQIVGGAKTSGASL